MSVSKTLLDTRPGRSAGFGLHSDYKVRAGTASAKTPAVKKVYQPPQILTPSQNLSTYTAPKAAKAPVDSTYTAPQATYTAQQATYTAQQAAPSASAPAANTMPDIIGFTPGAAEIYSSLKSQLKQLDDSAAYVTTVEQSDELDKRRRELIDRLGNMDVIAGRAERYYSADDRAGGVLKGWGSKTGASYTNLAGNLLELGGMLADKSSAADRVIADNPYVGWATDDLTAANFASAPASAATTGQLEADRREYERLYNNADEMYDAYLAEDAKTKNGLSKAGQFGIDAVHTLLDIGSDAAFKALTGGVSGLITMGARVYGQTAQQARQNGSDAAEAAAKGAAAAGIEILTEKISGPFENIYGKSLLSKKLNSAFGKLLKNDTARRVLTAIGESAGEGLEEGMSAVLNTVADHILDWDDGSGTIFQDLADDKSEILYDMLLGAFVGSLGAGGKAAGQYIGAKETRVKAADGVYTGSNGVRISEEAFAKMAEEAGIAQKLGLPPSSARPATATGVQTWQNYAASQSQAEAVSPALQYQQSAATAGPALQTRQNTATADPALQYQQSVVAANPALQVRQNTAVSQNQAAAATAAISPSAQARQSTSVANMDPAAAKALRMSAVGATPAQIRSATGCVITQSGDVVSDRTGKVLAKAQNDGPAEHSGAGKPDAPSPADEITPEEYMQIVQAAFAGNSIGLNTEENELSTEASHHERSGDSEYQAFASERLNSDVYNDRIKLQNGFAAFPKDDPLREYSTKVTPMEGCFDVAMHGTPNMAAFGSTTGNTDARLLAEIIRHSEGYNGQNIRLLSCSTGKIVDDGYCFAEELANALGVDVIAPNDVLYFSPSGRLTVGDKGRGSFLVFQPNQRRRRK